MTVSKNPGIPAPLSIETSYMWEEDYRNLKYRLFIDSTGSIRIGILKEDVNGEEVMEVIIMYYQPAGWDYYNYVKKKEDERQIYALRWISITDAYKEVDIPMTQFLDDLASYPLHEIYYKYRAYFSEGMDEGDVQ